MSFVEVIFWGVEVAVIVGPTGILLATLMDVDMSARSRACTHAHSTACVYDKSACVPFEEGQYSRTPLTGLWLSGSPITRIALALRVN